MKRAIRWVRLGFLLLASVASWAGPAGADWQVNTYTPGDQQYPDVAADPAGNFVVVWQSEDQDGSGTGVFAQRFDPGTVPVGTEQLINTTIIRDQGHPVVVMDEVGDFRVVWQSYNNDGDGDGVFQRRFDADANPLAPEEQVNSITTGDQHTPAVASHETTVLPTVTLWEDDSGPTTDVRVNLLPGGTALQVPSTTSNFEFDPAFDCLTLGEFPFPGDVTLTAAWASGDADGFGIFARRRHFVGFGPAQFQVNGYTTGIQRHPAVACDPDPFGNVMIVWESDGQDGDGLGVFGRLFDRVSLAPVGGEFQINQYTTSHQRFPDVAADADGNFIVVWQSSVQDGSGDGVFARRYDSLGAPLGSEFGVNQETVSAQLRPRVATIGAGTFVVVWASQGQDGDGRGVFARAFPSASAGETVSSPSAFVTTSVTTPNEGFVSIRPGDPSEFSTGFGFASVNIDAPAATPANPLVLVFQFHQALAEVLFPPTQLYPNFFELFTKVYRNGVEIPDCTGTPGEADPDPCVQSREIIGFELFITVLTSAASQWDFTIGDCPATVDNGCTTGFAKGSLTVQQGDPANQKLTAKLTKGPALDQSDLGNPLDPTAGGTGTIVALCVYDDGGDLAGELFVSRAGDLCGTGECWSPVGRAPNDPQGPGLGYKYKDVAQDATGVKSIVYKGGAAGQSKAIVKASGPNLPAGIAAALEGSTQATVQLRAVDGECLAATLTNVRSNSGGAFKAK